MFHHASSAQRRAGHRDAAAARRNLRVVRHDARGVRVDARHFGFRHHHFFVRSGFRHHHFANPATIFAHVKYDTIVRLARVDERLGALEGILSQIAAADPSGPAATALPRVQAALTRVNTVLANVAEATDFTELAAALAPVPAMPPMTVPTT